MSFQAMTWAIEQELPALQKLVLLMLANYCNHHTGQCNPSYDHLASDCGMSKTSVRDAIDTLREKGLLEIERRSVDGVSLPNQYNLIISGNGVPQGEGVCRHTRGGMPPHEGGYAATRGGVCRHTAPNLEVKPRIEPRIEPRAKALSFDAEKYLLGLDVDGQVAKDWLTHRKAVHAPPTKTAINAIVREASKSGISLQSALEICCQRGWRGFKAEWHTQSSRSYHDERADVIAQLTGRKPAHQSASDGDIDAEPENQKLDY